MAIAEFIISKTETNLGILKQCKAPISKVWSTGPRGPQDLSGVMCNQNCFHNTSKTLFVLTFIGMPQKAMVGKIASALAWNKTGDTTF